MSGRKNYSDEFKRRIVREYLEGKSGWYQVLQEKYGVGRSQLRLWVSLYEAGGIEELTCVCRTYNDEYKIRVIEYKHEHSLSLRQTAAHFGIQSLSIIAKWERIYYEEGEEALFKERRGRKREMSTKNSPKSKKNVNGNEDLLKEVQPLRMENKYFKKLIALVQEREKSGQQTKRPLFRS